MEHKYFLSYIEGLVSTVINTTLFVVKLWVGILSGSVAIVADAWHTLSDSVTSIIVVLGAWISSKKPDKEHPFGHGRAESIAAIIIGTLLGVIGFHFLKESITRLCSYQQASFSKLAIIVFLISLVFKEGLAQFAFWAGKTAKSSSLRADAWHHRSDAIASGLIVIGALLGKRLWWIDGAMGIIVSLLIFYTTYSILKESISLLLGKALSPQEERKIKALIKTKVPNVLSMHHFHIHRYGNHNELTLHITLPNEMNLIKAHSIGSHVERVIPEKMKIETTLHIEPGK